MDESLAEQKYHLVVILHSNLALVEFQIVTFKCGGSNELIFWYFEYDSRLAILLFHISLIYSFQI